MALRIFAHQLLVVSPNIVKSTAKFHRRFYFLSMSVRLSSARYFSLHMSPAVARPASSPPLCHRTTASASAAPGAMLGQQWSISNSAGHRDETIMFPKFHCATNTKFLLKQFRLSTRINIHSALVSSLRYCRGPTVHCPLCNV